MPGTTSSVPSPNFIKVGNTGQDQLGVGVTPGTQRAHVKSAVDEVTLYLEQAAATSTNNTLRVQTGNTSDPAVGVQVTGDLNNRLLVTSAGKITWGPGNATQDTNLYRQASAVLRTDQSLQVGANLTVTGTTTQAGVVTPGNEYFPSDHGFTAWTYDPALVSNGTNTVSGTVYLARVILRYSATVNKVMLSLTNAASTVTANQNFVGIYDSTGTRQAVTAAGSIDSALTSAGTMTATLSTSPTLAAGQYWVAFVNNATTPAQLGRMGSFSGTPNANLSQSNYRFAVNGTGATSLPASITPGSNTSTNNITFWAAIFP